MAMAAVNEAMAFRNENIAGLRFKARTFAYDIANAMPLAMAPNGNVVCGHLARSVFSLTDLRADAHDISWV
jgi:hypothetical protein